MPRPVGWNATPTTPTVRVIDAMTKFKFASSAAAANAGQWHEIEAEDQLEAFKKANEQVPVGDNFNGWYGEGTEFVAGYGCWD